MEGDEDGFLGDAHYTCNEQNRQMSDGRKQHLKSRTHEYSRSA